MTTVPHSDRATPVLPDEWKGIVRRFRDGQVLPREEEQMRDMALSGYCPFCGAGPFKAVAIHVVRVEGIGRREFRDRLGLLVRTVLTTPEYHAERAELSRQQQQANPRVMPTSRRGRRHHYTKAGREVQRQKALAQLERDPGRMQALGKMVRPETRAKAGRAGGRARADRYTPTQWSAKMREAHAHRVRIPRSEYDSVRRRREAGESTDSIAASYGASRGLVNQILSGKKDGPAT